MKKFRVIGVIGLLLLFTVAFARVVVLQDGKTMSFADNSQIVVSGKTPARVLYDGVLVTVSPNQKVKIRKEEMKKEDGDIERRIIISGTDLKDIKVHGKTITSQGATEVALSIDNTKIDVIKGKVYTDGILLKEVPAQEKSIKSAVTKQSAENQPVVKPIISETIEFPDVSDYVDELAFEQSVQDVEDMSQYAPRS